MQTGGEETDVPLRRGLPLALLAGLGLAYGLAALAYTLIPVGGRLVNAAGATVGNDFLAFWAAARLAVEGRAASAWDDQVFLPLLATLSPAVNPTPFAYPPPFLLVVAPLAWLSYPLALAVWEGATLLPFVLLVRRLAGVPLAVALMLPAIAHNLAIGQNGLLSASLLAGGVAALAAQRRWLAGALFGLLAIKPQMAVLLPACLLAGGHFAALGAAAVTAAALAAASLAVFGDAAWAGFLAHLPVHMAYVTQGVLPVARFPTVFAALLDAAGPAAAGWAQAAASLVAMAAAAWAWRRTPDPAARLLVLSAALPLSTPFLLDYDLAVSAVPAAWLAGMAWRGRARAADWPALALLWVLPPAIWAASLAHLRVGLPLAAVLLAYALWRVACQHPDPRR